MWTNLNFCSLNFKVSLSFAGMWFFVNIKVLKVSKEDNTFLAINLISHPSLIRTAKQEFLAENHKGVV